MSNNNIKFRTMIQKSNSDMCQFLEGKTSWNFVTVIESHSDEDSGFLVTSGNMRSGVCPIDEASDMIMVLSIRELRVAYLPDSRLWKRTCQKSSEPSFRTVLVSRCCFFCLVVPQSVLISTAKGL